MATYVTTQAMLDDCAPQGKTGSESVNTGALSVLNLARVLAGDDTARRRPMLRFDLTGFTAASSAITAAQLDLDVTRVATAVDDVRVDQIWPQCSNATFNSTQAASFDAAECDWLEMAGGSAAWDWLDFGGDTYSSQSQTPDHTFLVDAPTSLGTWTINHANLAGMVKESIDRHENILLLRFKWDVETGVSTEDVRVNSDAHATLFPKLTITYNDGGGGKLVNRATRLGGLVGGRLVA